jgi:NAD/NADP transhydrogenase beta subunit
MASGLLLASWAVILAGAIVGALADAWLSRSILRYLDAIEDNVGKLVEAVRAGETDLKVTGIDRKRDRAQDRARALKMLGWVVMVLGFGMQLAAAWIGPTGR